jgi:hypothetical protein
VVILLVGLIISRVDLLFGLNDQILSFKNEYVKLTSTTVLSRAFVGTLLGSFWQHNLMTAVSKFGARRIGS